MTPIKIKGYTLIKRPGYFGRRRDEIVADLNKKYGNTWTLVWTLFTAEDLPNVNLVSEYHNACKLYYEQSYYEYLKLRPEVVNRICEYGECIDNAITNIQSGLDYTKQEAFSTHIQDIAVRNVLKRLGRKFEGPSDKILIIRGEDTDGWKLGLNPGLVPFMFTTAIHQPSKAPKWAQKGSVEDFWQSNKYLAIKINDSVLDRV